MRHAVCLSLSVSSRFLAETLSCGVSVKSPTAGKERKDVSTHTHIHTQTLTLTNTHTLKFIHYKPPGA